MPDEKVCETCHHWQQDLDYVVEGNCAKLTVGARLEGDDHALLPVNDEHTQAEYGGLITGCDFGCILFEPKS